MIVKIWCGPPSVSVCSTKVPSSALMRDIAMRRGVGQYSTAPAASNPVKQTSSSISRRFLIGRTLHLLEIGKLGQRRVREHGFTARTPAGGLPGALGGETQLAPAIRAIGDQIAS